jgi:hypothetical protein
VPQHRTSCTAQPSDSLTRTFFTAASDARMMPSLQPTTPQAHYERSATRGAASAFHWLWLDCPLPLSPLLMPPVRDPKDRLRLEQATGVVQSAVRVKVAGSILW